MTTANGDEDEEIVLDYSQVRWTKPFVELLGEGHIDSTDCPCCPVLERYGETKHVIHNRMDNRWQP